MVGQQHPKLLIAVCTPASNGHVLGLGLGAGFEPVVGFEPEEPDEPELEEPELEELHVVSVQPAWD